MKLKKGSGTLLEEMEQYLPIPARPTKELSQYFRKQGIHIDMNRDLNIIAVFDSGDMGGIVCAIEGDKKQKQAHVISITHLTIKPDHPLSDKIVAYQKQRIKSLQSQRPFRFAE
jgi:hypothetical protein